MSQHKSGYDKLKESITDSKSDKDKPQFKKAKEDKKEKQKKAVFLERTEEQKKIDKESREAEIKAINDRYDNIEKHPELDPKWNGLVCGSCLQLLREPPQIFELEDATYNDEPVNYVQDSTCRANNKPITLYVQETETGFIEVLGSAVVHKKDKKDKDE